MPSFNFRDAREMFWFLFHFELQFVKVWSDAAFCGVLSGFALDLLVYVQKHRTVYMD